MRAILSLLVAFGLLMANVSHGQELGVVMMHGKWSTPPPWHIGVSNAIKHEGWPVTELTMPWSGHRLYDAPYEAALKQIANAVVELRVKGVKRVVVGGHSFGANAAIAYAASGGELDGILAMGPGHNPRVQYERGATKDAITLARKLVAEGHGNESVSFTDTNQGQHRNLGASASIFLSYFEPEGLGDIPTSMARIVKPLPVLWVIGTRDPLYPHGESYAYGKAPPHPLSRYVVVEANHLDTPSAGSEQIIDWLHLLARQP